MRNRRLTGAALGMLGAAALLLGGCSADDGGSADSPVAGGGSASAPNPGASGTADPAAASALGQATAALGTTSFKVTLTAGPGLKLEGLMDAPNGKGTGTLTATGANTEINVKTLIVDKDLYVQIPGITKGGTWTHVDVSRLPEGANVGLRPGQIDPAGATQLLTATTNVQQVDPRNFTGSLDLTKAAGVAGFNKASIDAYGAAAQSVPFTAGLDEQGRLSVLTVRLPAINGQQPTSLEILYTDYGTTVTAEKPAAAQITEAPDNFYSQLGG